MKLFITGGTGFIGSRLALRCLDREDQLVVLGQRNTPAETANCDELEKMGAQIVEASITDPELYREHLDGVDVVIHLAAIQHEMNIPDQRFRDVNVGGTEKILDASVGAGVRRFVHGSTIGVYGTPTTTVDEATPCEPDNIYGVTKLEGERRVLGRKDDLEVVVIRIPEVYGPGDQRLIKLYKAINNKTFFRIGGGRNVHHLIFVEDLIDGLLLAAEHPSAPGQLFLLAGKEAVTTDEMVDTIADQIEAPRPRLRAPMLPFVVLATLMEFGLRPLGIQPPLHRRRLDFFRKTFTLSARHAEQTIGFNPQVGFAEGARRTGQHYRKMWSEDKHGTER